MHRTLLSLTVAVVLGLSATLASATAVKSETSTVTTQLPRGVLPLHYDVRLEPDAKAMSFTARTTIALQLLQPTRHITLHAAGLHFSRVELTPQAGSAQASAPKVQLNAAAQTATFVFDKTLPTGAYRLAMDYSGSIGTQAYGLFALDYGSGDERQRALFTQFENSDARRLIPSWDEPVYKATFALQVTVPSAQMAVSNMPISARQDLGDGRTQLQFQTTPKMSTYLLFFALGDFERATQSQGATEVGVITKKGSLAQAGYALESSKTVLAEYNDYFGVNYPLPKLDNIAAPGGSQFFSAMENWGAIFSFEHALLLDPSISTQTDRQRVFVVAAHEIAHQWFGNLVTMRWWDDLWLNEGFASWMESRTTARLNPQWHHELGAVHGRERAMQLDALQTSHPVVQHITDVEQASQAFDAITYQKGEAVIGMLEGFVGSDAWRAGVRGYFKKYAYGSTASADFWGAIDASAGQPVSQMARDFTLQAGVPLIRVQDVACVDGRTTLNLAQGEFSKDQPNKKPLHWRVPVMAKTLGDAGAPGRVVVADGRAQMTLNGCGTVVVNAGQSGYYRTLYQPEQFRAIVQAFGSLAPVDQLGVLTDSWALGQVGLQPSSDVLALISATPADADPAVWGQIADVLVAIDALYQRSPERQAKFRQFALARLRPVMQGLGTAPVADEEARPSILRNQLIVALGTLGDVDLIADARSRYARSQSDPTALPPAIRKAVLEVVALHADAGQWAQLHQAAQAEKTPLVRDKLYQLLAGAQDEALGKQALALALQAEVGATNSAAMIEGVARRHPALAFDFALAHLDAVNRRVDESSRSRYFAGLAREADATDMIRKVDQFARKHLAAGSRRSAKTAMADIAFRIRTRRGALPALDAWLRGVM